MRMGTLAAIFFLSACGGGGSGDDTTAPDAMGNCTVPDPGAGGIPFSWPDTEPNDTACHAVPLGTSVTAGEATWFDGTADSGSLGGTDRADFFVFKSSPQGGNFHAGPCWDGTQFPNLMDFYFYKIVGGQVDSMVGSSEDIDGSCENQLGGADVAMEASTTYVLELRAVGNEDVSTTYGA